MGDRGGGDVGRYGRAKEEDTYTRARKGDFATRTAEGYALATGQVAGLYGSDQTGWSYAKVAADENPSGIAKMLGLSEQQRQANFNANALREAKRASRDLSGGDAHELRAAEEAAKKRAAEEAAAKALEDRLKALEAANKTKDKDKDKDDKKFTVVSSCFVDGVLVETPEGERNVSTIKVGDLVRTKRGEGMVKEVHPAVAGGQRLYGFNDKAPFVTEAHPFMTQDGWKRVDELVTGDTLYRNGKGDVVVDTITIRDIPEDTPVYNFHVGGGSETYYADGYLVHNKTYPTDEVPETTKTTDYTKMLTDMQAAYDKQLSDFQATMDAATKNQEDQLTALTEAMEEKKKKVSATKKKKTGRLSLLFGSELGVTNKLLGGS